MNKQAIGIVVAIVVIILVALLLKGKKVESPTVDNNASSALSEQVDPGYAITPTPPAPPVKSNKNTMETKTTTSGISYKVLTKGTGDTHPTLSSTVNVNYEGKFTDGKIFDSSYQRGQSINFPLASLIKGWQEGIPLMVKGDVFEFTIPGNLAYGTHMPDGSLIPDNGTLIFKVELIDFK